MKNKFILLITGILFLSSYFVFGQTEEFHEDKPFMQEFSIKYDFDNARVELKKVASDRNGYIQILSSHGLLRPRDGQFLFPGTLVKDVQYQPTSDKGIKDIAVVDNQLVYIDDKAVLSNAWAGKLYSRHQLPEAKIFAAGNDFTFLISDGIKLNLLKDSKTLWEGTISGEAKDIDFDASNNQFWILSKGTISTFSPKNNKLEKVTADDSLTCIEVAGDKLFAGTTDGYFEIDTKTKKQVGEIHRKLPWTEHHNH